MYSHPKIIFILIIATPCETNILIVGLIIDVEIAIDNHISNLSLQGCFISKNFPNLIRPNVDSSSYNENKNNNNNKNNKNNNKNNNMRRHPTPCKKENRKSAKVASGNV